MLEERFKRIGIRRRDDTEVLQVIEAVWQQRYEDLPATLAAGARWRVLALIAALALTGLAATALLALAGAAFVLGVIAARL